MPLQMDYFQTDVSPLVNARDERRATRLFVGGAAAGSGIAEAGDFAVSPGTGLAVSVAACAEGGGLVWAPGRFSHRGSYLAYLDAPATVTLDVADSSQARTDLVVIAMHDGEYEGDTSFTFSVTKVTGTPGGGVPTPTGDAYVLAQVAVAANQTTVTTGNITDKRTRLARGGVSAYSERTAPLVIAASATTPCPPPSFTGYWTTSGDRVTINKAGIIAVSLIAQRQASGGTSTDIRPSIKINGLAFYDNGTAYGGPQRYSLGHIFKAAVGATIDWNIQNTLGNSTTFDISATITYLGTGP